MDILYLMIPLSLLLLVLIVGGAIWAVLTGQFDDLDSPAHRILDNDQEE
ncbi:MAG: cbb3-type cytochrome oxidase assembly protein CcoS [Gammaproteobacteria bacterium]|nr:cbb3-type cytochrome oxidase assembly protein CcoS [Gammaproteobacteria bacterium]MCY4218508.1 cbb3-type cytochrome oxidase assembly protein CcoS [Gammaproteobacteria bacterium]